MLDGKFCNAVLTIGCDYRTTKGGIAQVLSSYSKHLFSPFHFIANSGNGGKFAKLFEAAGAWIKCLSFLARHKAIRVVHIHTASGVSFWRSAAFLLLAKAMRRAVVMHIHGGYFRQFYHAHSRTVGALLRRCDELIVLSDEWKAFFESFCDKPVFVLNNVVEPPVKVQVEHDGKVHALFLGLVTKEKGVYDLVEAVARLDREVRNRLVVHMAGNGEVDKLKTEVDRHAVTDCVTVEGWVAGEAKTRLLNRCSTFVLPSYIEALPISVLECMSYGMPIIATKVGAIPTLVQIGENGTLIQPGDVGALADALTQCVMRQEEWAKMGTNSLKSIEAYYPEAVQMRLTHIYETLLK